MNEVHNYYRLVQAGFEKVAPYYDLITVPISGVREQVADLLASGNALTVLDIATGTGAQAFAFAKRGYNVVGIDLSEPMLRIAESKNRNKHVRFEVADATNLPYPNHSFDVACISFALHDMLLAIRLKVLNEMARVTRPLGTILVVDYDLPRNRLGRFLIYRLVSLYEASYYSEFIQSDLRGLLGQAGIEIEREIPVLLGAGRILKGKRVQ